MTNVGSHCSVLPTAHPHLLTLPHWVLPIGNHGTPLCEALSSLTDRQTQGCSFLQYEVALYGSWVMYSPSSKWLWNRGVLLYTLNASI